MSDDLLNDPQHPDRPQHPDFWALSDIILRMDGAVTEGGSTVADVLDETGIDQPSLEYHALQRAMRVQAALHGVDASSGRLPEHIFRGNRNRRTMALFTAIYLEAFTVGYHYANKEH